MSGANSTSYTYEITLVPIGTRYSKSVTSTQSSTSIHLYYALPWDEDNDSASIRSAVTTIAHESFHIATAIKHVSINNYTEEVLAYKVGVCIQFDITGHLSLPEIWRTDIESKDMSGSAAASVSAGAQAAKYFYGYFNDSEELFRSSKPGMRLANDCANIVNSAFQNPT